MKICITTYFDDKYKTLGNMCEVSLKRYASTYGYDLRVFHRIESGRPSSWNKLLIIQELFKEGYDYVFWVDADAMFVRFDHDVCQLIDNQHTWYMTTYPEPDGHVPNCGIMLIQNTDENCMILKRLWEAEQHIHSEWWEQTAFIEYFGFVSEVPKKFQRLFNALGPNHNKGKHLQACIKWLPEQWNYKSNQLRTPADVIIRHYSGERWRFKFLTMFADIVKSDHLYYLKNLHLVVLAVLAWGCVWGGHITRYIFRIKPLGVNE